MYYFFIFNITKNPLAIMLQNEMYQYKYISFIKETKAS